MTRTEIEFFLSKIIKDELFSSSPKYIKLLELIATKSLDGELLKEYIIGDELFSKNYNLGKNDGIVRVYMYNLRKKLAAYYLKNGKEDSVVFILDKGGYNIRFEQAKKKSIIRRPIYIAAIALTMLTLAISTLLLWCKQEYYLWDNYINGDAPTKCILADHVICGATFNGVNIGLTHPKIGNKREYINYIQSNPEESLRLYDYTLFSKSIPFSLLSISELFCRYDRHINLLLESEFRYEDSDKANIIFIGQSKIMNVSKRIFLKDSNIFKFERAQFLVKKDGKTKSYKAIYKNHAIMAEYAMISYMPLDDKHDAIYFVSNHDIGVIDMVKNFTNLDYLEEFYKRLPSKDCHFNALFKVTGFNRSSIDSELVELEVIETVI